MKIALISPYDIIVPPLEYGGIELVVSKLADGLVKRGHDVSLFAAKGSKTKANLVSYGPPIGIGSENRENLLLTLTYLYKTFSRAKEFDLIHNHAGRLPLFFASLISTPFVSTLHTPLPDSPDAKPRGKYQTMEEFSNLPFVSISNNQREPFPKLNYVATVYNGTVDENIYKLGKGDGGYLVWIGRFDWQKGPHIAIKVAKELGVPIKLAGKYPEDDNYFKSEVEPLIDGKAVISVGEVNEEEKVSLLQGAVAFMNPIQWREPFGLVVPEANACGTPVVAFKQGAMNELIENNRNGIIVEPGNISQMVDATKKIIGLPTNDMAELRHSSREVFLSRFTITKMIEGYESVYQKVVANN